MAAIDIFEQAVHETLINWSVLRIAKEHGFGGRNALDKENWLVASVNQIFKDNDVVYADELEDYISEAIFNEFDTIVEDGSLRKICNDICSYYSLCKSNQTEKVVKLVVEMKQKINYSKVVVQNKDDSDEDEVEEKQVNNHASLNNGSSPHTETVADREINNDMEIDTTVENDGWEVVKRSKKR